MSGDFRVVGSRHQLKNWHTGRGGGSINNKYRGWIGINIFVSFSDYNTCFLPLLVISYYSIKIQIKNVDFIVSEPKYEVKPLVELAAQCVALYIPYELVEQEYPPVPEELQLRIAFWSFPDNEEDIRLYSCLANSNSDEFLRGHNLYASSAIKDCVQIGFHLSANVHHGGRNVFNVAITFDRKKITTCNCTCEPMSYWCSHVVAVCLHRIYRVRNLLLKPVYF